MSIIEELSSSTGQRTQEANTAVAEKCVADPALLEDVVAVLAEKNARLVGDAAEVLTKVAEQRPELVAEHAPTLLGLVAHKNGRVRWESAHAFSLVADRAVALVGKELPRLQRILEEEPGVIVRDYVADAVVRYATTGEAAFKRALPLLRQATVAWESKHAARILVGLQPLLESMPKHAAEVAGLAEGLEEHPRAGVRKAARSLLRRAKKIVP